jgi:quercetin dioxygenase-like cupin family protein
LGTIHTLLVTGKETEGRLTVAMVEVPPGVQVPPHIHEREDEWFYVMEGTMEFTSEGKTSLVTPGMSYFGPRNASHGVRCLGASTARMLVAIFPAGLEEMFVELSRLPAGSPDLPRAMAICAKHGISFV